MKHDRSETTVVNKKTTGMVGARAESIGVETKDGRPKRNASMLSRFLRLKRVSSESVKRMKRRNSSLGREEEERKKEKYGGERKEEEREVKRAERIWREEEEGSFDVSKSFPRIRAFVYPLGE